LCRDILLPPFPRKESALKVAYEVEKDIKNRTNAIEKTAKESALFSTAEVSMLETLQNTMPLAVDRLKEAHEEEIAELMNENQMLTGLATLGIALVVFGHETSQIINAMTARVRLLAGVVPHLPDEYRPKIEGDIQALKVAIERVETWGQFALDHVKRDKRTFRNLDFNGICESVLDAFSNLFSGRSIKLVKEFGDNLPTLRGFAMDIEGIIINLITNSVEALRPTPLKKRCISVSTDFSGPSSSIVLTFSDSGKGILEQDLGKIFNPLFTTRVDRDGQPTGTGVGLTIVRNIVDQYQGSIEVEGHGELGGAAFKINIPVKSGGET
jgi:signal transduction histidine kinase